MVEKSVELTVVSKAERQGWFVRKLAWMGRKGGQDRFFLKAGRHVFIEFKDKGKPEQPLQALNREKMQAQGAECHVVDNIADGMRILGLA